MSRPQTVNRIVNIKPLQQQTATMLTGHVSREIILTPDSMRTEYAPGDEFIITINASNCDYINLEDSVLWIKVRTKGNQNFWYVDTNIVDHVWESEPGTDWGPKHCRHGIPALGGASFIQNLTIQSGTTKLCDYNYYWGLYGTIAEMHAPRGFRDYETHLNVSRDEYPVSRTFRSAQDDQGYLTSQFDSWIKIPIISPFNDAGFIPNYQTANKLKFVFTLNTNDGALKMTIRPPPNENPMAYTNEGDTTQMGINNMNSEIPNGWATARNVGSFRHIQKWSPVDWSWTIQRVEMHINALTAISGAVLDANPVEIYTKSYTAMHSPTSGQIEESIPFQIKKSSIRSVHAIFVNQKANRTQDWGAVKQDQWCRAGLLGSVSLLRNPDDPFHEDNNPFYDYDPSIVWWSVRLGGDTYPTPNGTGTNRNPVFRDENVHIMHRAYNRFLMRNSIAGSGFSPSLTAFNEEDHGLMLNTQATHPSAFEGGVHHRQHGLMPFYGDPDYVNINYNSPNFAHHPIAALPNWSGMALSLYGGYGWRTSYQEFTQWDNGDTITEFPQLFPPNYPNMSGQSMEQILTPAYTHQAVNNLTGGKFILACSFNPMEKASRLIQGVDTERFDFNINFTRHEAIQRGLKVNGALKTTLQSAGSKIIGCPSATLVEDVPMMISYWCYDVKLTLANGVVVIED